MTQIHAARMIPLSALSLACCLALVPPVGPALAADATQAPVPMLASQRAPLAPSEQRTPMIRLTNRCALPLTVHFAHSPAQGEWHALGPYRLEPGQAILPTSGNRPLPHLPNAYLQVHADTGTGQPFGLWEEAGPVDQSVLSDAIRISPTLAFRGTRLAGSVAADQITFDLTCPEQMMTETW